jgi:hypothetical protein
MTLNVADRVQVLWTGTGSGTITLGAAIPSFQGFPASLNGLLVGYSIAHETSPEAEAGIGLYSSGANTLTRQYRTYPSRGGSAISFSAGNKFVRLTRVSTEDLNVASTNPTVSDDITLGYVEGRSRWLNTASNALFFCCDHAAGAAVWTASGGGAGAVSSVNGLTGTVLLDADDLSGAYAPANYTPSGTGTIRDHFVAIDGELASASADAAPGHVTASGAEYVLLLTSREHINQTVWSGQANQDIEVPATAPADSIWIIKFKHTGVTISVDGNPASSTINGIAGGAGTVQGVNGGVGIIEIDANAGSAPVVLVRGDIIFDSPDVTGTKTYTNDDHAQDFTLTTTSTQTIGAAAGYRSDFYCNLFATTGTTTIAGGDASYSAVAPDAILVKKVGSALWALGKHSSSPVILDAV